MNKIDRFIAEHVIPALAGITLGLLLTIAIFAINKGGREQGEASAKAAFQKESVAAGHAEYIIDADGSPKWQWKSLAPASK